MLETVLGPMEGVSDFPFRVWVNLISKPTASYTPFLRLTESFPSHQMDPGFWPEVLVPSLKEKVWWKTQLQVMTPTPSYLVRLIKHLPPDHDAIDMNCGCPSKTVTGKGSGSSLLKTVEGFQSFTEECVDYLNDSRMSLKMRTGFHDESLFKDLVSCLPRESLNHLTVHGRTREQKYSGKADWCLIDTASKLFKGKVFGSGDVVCRDSLKDRLRLAPNLTGVFIARGAIQKPWIFSELSDPSFKVTYKQALIYLQAFHWLTRLWDEDSPETFLPCILEARLLHQNPCHESWLNFLDYLKADSNERSEFTDKNTRRSLARTKMVWSYMRMNWSATSMLPGPLRADGFESMMDELQRIEIEDT